MTATFFDAVVGDRRMAQRDKVRWLHTTAQDYWERLEAVRPVLREVAEHLDPTGTPRDDSGSWDLWERVVEALQVVEGGR